jgi:hypothetical protein
MPLIHPQLFCPAFSQPIAGRSCVLPRGMHELKIAHRAGDQQLALCGLMYPPFTQTCHLQLRTRRLSDGAVRETPAKPVQRPSSSPPRGVSPALSRAPSDNLATPTLQYLRRPADFGSPGVAVASASSASRSSATSLRAQDDAMEMLLQVLAPLCHAHGRHPVLLTYSLPRRCRSLQARPSTRTRALTWCGSSCR